MIQKVCWLLSHNANEVGAERPSCDVGRRDGEGPCCDVYTARRNDKEGVHKSDSLSLKEKKKIEGLAREI